MTDRDKALGHPGTQEGSGGVVLTEALPSGAILSRMSAARSCLSLAAVREYDYRIGHIITRFGIVGIYDQGRRIGGDQITRLDVVSEGRLYTATWRRTFSDRFLITLATRFAADAAA